MITDKQATVLRACASFGVPTGRWPGVDDLWDLKLIEAHSNSSWGERATSYSVSNAGYRALAEYDAAHTTLTKDQLAEVFHAGYKDGWNDRTGLHDKSDERWRLSNIWDNLKTEG